MEHYELQEMIKDIQSQMVSFHGFLLTDQQIIDYINEINLEYFGTVQREDFVDYLSVKITGIKFPRYKDTKQQRDEFFSKLKNDIKNTEYKMKN